MQEDMEKIVTGKMVVLGDQGVGKTSLVLRYVEKEYNRFISPTIGASYFSCAVEIQDITVKLQIWDTAGQERFKAMAPMFYRNASAAMLVYDITRPETFENIKNWISELQKNVEQRLVLCIVGTKLDLASERKISRDEAIKYSNSIGAYYHECSALKDQGIDKIFHNTALELVKLSGEKLATHSDYGESSNRRTTDVGAIVTLRGTKDNISHGDVVKSNCC